MIATIKDLPINHDQKLTPMVIKNLVDIVNQEFNRQKTIYDSKASEEKEKILEKYRKSCAYYKLEKEHSKTEELIKANKEKQDQIEAKINKLGLTLTGDILPSHWAKTPEDKKIIDKLERLIQAVYINGPDNIRNKIVARLWVSTTIGEALVILHEALGNGVLPSIKKEDLECITWKG